MRIGAATVTLYAPWVHSLKEKRMVVKSLCAKVRGRFSVSIAEVDAHDLHQTIVLGFACVTGSTQQAHRILDTVLAFMESHTEAEITGITREVL